MHIKHYWLNRDESLGENPTELQKNIAFVTGLRPRLETILQNYLTQTIESFKKERPEQYEQLLLEFEKLHEGEKNAKKKSEMEAHIRLTTPLPLYKNPDDETPTDTMPMGVNAETFTALLLEEVATRLRVAH